ncbi:MAG: N-acetyltransferase family protein [Bdellovibrio sp.]
MENRIDIRIRPAEKGDLGRLAELSSQLGYENSVKNLNERFDELNRSGDHVLLVAELLPSKVIGLAYFKKHKSFFVGESLEVGGLVVDKAHRGLGIGKLLMSRAEDIAKNWNLQSIRLTSNIKRTEAHRFYRSLGYEQPKTSHFFMKKI